MHVRVRLAGQPDKLIVLSSKLTKIEQFRRVLKTKFNVAPKLQRLLYGGKLLEDGYTFHDYNIKLHDVIQLLVIQETSNEKNTSESQKKSDSKNNKSHDMEIAYTDATSSLYAVGDLIDMRNRTEGYWLEGKIVEIVIDPTTPESTTSLDISESGLAQGKEKTNVEKEKVKGIQQYFAKQTINKEKDTKSREEYLLFKVKLEDYVDEPYCHLKEFRPRARTVIDVKDLEPGQMVMINHNMEKPSHKGHWYDFKVDEVIKLRRHYDLIGTLYIGQDAIPQNDTKVTVHDKIFAIEEVVPLANRTVEYQNQLAIPPENRSKAIKCPLCCDINDRACKECGCGYCGGKESPEKIILCDECNNGFHLACLVPPLSEIPDGDWYCPSCKLDTNQVVAPGAAKQTRKTNRSNKDWGRGMACVGKSKTCAMPANHFGPIPGIEVGMCWKFRIQLSESGVHRPPVSGIHGRDVEGAYSIVLSGGYEDDYDNGNEFTYTGSGGRDLSGNKRTAQQSCDQKLTRENRALARNCFVTNITDKGGDAGEAWKEGKPVRVVRSSKMLKHFPKYAPQEGIRYDGIYKVVRFYPARGLSGYKVWKYLLRRDDPSPAPWETGAQQHPIIYPDGYLEAEAEKKALQENANTGKGKKRVLKDNNKLTSASAAKKRKTANGSVSPDVQVPSTSRGTQLSDEEKEAIICDTMNSKHWAECLEICEKKGKKEFIEHVTKMFLCIICQEVAVAPVTTPCLHNFCMGCIKLAFKCTEAQVCPCCRQDLSAVELSPNEMLKTALRTILAGYDAGKK